MGLYRLTRALSVMMEPSRAKSESTQACLAWGEPIHGSSGIRNAVSRRKFAVMLAIGFYLVLSGKQALSAEPQKKPAAKEAPNKQVTLKQEDIRLIEEGILRLTNKYRSEKGLNPLESSVALGLLAQHQAFNMCNAGLLAHESDKFPEGWRKFTERLAIVGARSGAENIAFGTILKDPNQWTRTVMKGWMKSLGHRKNILNPKFRYLGVAVNPCAQNLAYATQVFSDEPGRIRHGQLTR